MYNQIYTEANECKYKEDDMLECLFVNNLAFNKMQNVEI